MVSDARDAVLGIETSCDETAASVVRGGQSVMSSVISSQLDLHARFGGVVPEIASRAHLDLLLPVVSEALSGAQVEGPSLAAVAVTTGPGLAGALLVGVSAAKALALAWGVPYVAVNHLEGHLYAASLEEEKLEYPIVTLLVSGGHTMLVLVQSPGNYRLMGETVDDAAGEAFDKVARALGLGYPGGPAIDAMAKKGDPSAIPFPRPMMGAGLSFSFSGLKTAVTRWVREHPDAEVADVAASFQQAVVDVLVSKAATAARQVGAMGICLGGGVAANAQLREAIVEACAKEGMAALLPSKAMCTDNAAMIAAAGWHRLRSDGPSPLDTPAEPDLSLVAHTA